MRLLSCVLALASSEGVGMGVNLVHKAGEPESRFVVRANEVVGMMAATLRKERAGGEINAYRPSEVNRGDALLTQLDSNFGVLSQVLKQTVKRVQGLEDRERDAVQKRQKAESAAVAASKNPEQDLADQVQDGLLQLKQCERDVDRLSSSSSKALLEKEARQQAQIEMFKKMIVEANSTAETWEVKAAKAKQQEQNLETQESQVQQQEEAMKAATEELTSENQHIAATIQNVLGTTGTVDEYKQALTRVKAEKVKQANFIKVQQKKLETQLTDTEDTHSRDMEQAVHLRAENEQIKAQVAALRKQLDEANKAAEEARAAKQQSLAAVNAQIIQNSCKRLKDLEEQKEESAETATKVPAAPIAHKAVAKSSSVREGNLDQIEHMGAYESIDSYLINVHSRQSDDVPLSHAANLLESADSELGQLASLMQED
mmetsp:Transcript_49784/g.131321  ORF Transcript_49784/g.131321 Transcript_49784/m.131321 type:complete len:430 (+) Transcript_49784:79-1368(+)